MKRIILAIALSVPSIASASYCGALADIAAGSAADAKRGVPLASTLDEFDKAMESVKPEDRAFIDKVREIVIIAYSKSLDGVSVHDIWSTSRDSCMVGTGERRAL